MEGFEDFQTEDVNYSARVSMRCAEPPLSYGTKACKGKINKKTNKSSSFIYTKINGIDT